MEIYFDNSATTCPSPKVIAKMTDALTNIYGNPSSLHRLGMAAEKELTASRQVIAGVLGVEPYNIIFTGSGTEGNNMAILGVARANKKRGNQIITTAIEHPAILNTMKQLEEEGFEITYLNVDDTGVINLDALERAISDKTILISVMYVNNEVGSIMPLAGIADIIARQNHKIYFHSDGVQAFGKMPINLPRLGIDLFTLSGHKIHGPKGIGALYIKKDVRINPIIFGGGQERNMRSGTENLAGIIGLATATAEIHENIEKQMADVAELRKVFLAELSGLSGVKVNLQNGLANILNISFAGCKSEVLLHYFEARGLYVSSGSACSSKSKHGSHVLIAMGLTSDEIDSAIRFSFSHINTIEEIKVAAGIVIDSVNDLRKILGGMR